MLTLLLFRKILKSSFKLTQLAIKVALLLVHQEVPHLKVVQTIERMDTKISIQS